MDPYSIIMGEDGQRKGRDGGGRRGRVEERRRRERKSRTQVLQVGVGGYKEGQPPSPWRWKVFASPTGSSLTSSVTG